MKLHNNLHKLLASTIVVLFTSFILGCSSTEKTTETTQCVPQNTQACPGSENQDGEDRGYDPCLINENLPVCKG